MIPVWPKAGEPNNHGKHHIPWLKSKHDRPIISNNGNPMIKSNFLMFFGTHLPHFGWAILTQWWGWRLASDSVTFASSQGPFGCCLAAENMGQMGHLHVHPTNILIKMIGISLYLLSPVNFSGHKPG